MSTLANPALLASVVDALSTIDAPAISAYELGKLVYLKGNLSQSESPKSTFDALQKTLRDVRLIAPLEGSPAFTVFGHTSALVGEIACCLDPFAYVSHLSAMEYHGLTDRFPKLLYMTRPTPLDWSKQADARMDKDLGTHLEHYRQSKLPLLTRPAITKIRDTVVSFKQRSHMGAFRTVAGSSLRVATIGRVFLDMLREPKLCGGIQHVLDVYQDHAKPNIRLIVDEFDRHGSGIDKVRAGYVLTELCHLEHPTIQTWLTKVQRGGSRKLDPDGEFSSNFSETWKLSLNVPSLMRSAEL